MAQELVLMGCGDVGPIHQPITQYSELVGGPLASADIRFAQVERVYSERGELQPHGGAHGRLPPHMASVITDCGFNVVSLAGNHARDWGPTRCSTRLICSAPKTSRLSAPAAISP